MKLIDQVTMAEIALPNDLLWVDEFEWTAVLSGSEYSITGSLLIDRSVKLAGRPISLEAPDNEMAWISRATHEALRAAASIPDRRFKLLLEYPTDHREFTVEFAPVETPLEGSPVKGFPEHESDAWFSVKLKFIEVV